MKNQKSRKTHTYAPHSVKVGYWLERCRVSVVAASITTLICSSVTAADLEIYKVPEASTGTTTLMLMLDMSGSMKYGMNTSSDATAGNQRLDILKQGLRDVLQGTATTDPVDDKVVLGLATFAGDNGYIRIPAKALGEETGGADIEIRKILWEYQDRVLTSNDYRACEDWNLDWSCKRWGSWRRSSIIGSYDGRYDQGSSRYYYNVVKRRKETHRDVLLAEINNNLNANGGTPTPYAYAEAASYLMGTNTLDTSTNVQAYFVRSNNNYIRCADWNSNGTCKSNGWYGWYSNFSYPDGYTRGASASLYGENGSYYIGAKPNPYSGFNTSATYSGVTSGNNYAMPASIRDQIGDTPEAKAKRECSGQGIYFLTDGEPWVDSGTVESMMQTTLDTKGSDFSCANSPLGQNSPYKNVDAKVWQCIGNYAKTLLDPAKNPVGLKIKTAVVGFSSGFSSDGNTDVEDAKKWGTIGEGKWYVGTNSQSVVDSINNFINELNTEIPSLSTGASTIPVDALNPEIIQPYAYFPQLEPKVDPTETQQLWFGNVKKYYVVNNGVYSNENGGAANTVVLKSTLQDLQDAWAKAGITYPEKTPIYKKGGALSQLILGRENRTDPDGNAYTAERKILTDYKYDGTQDEPISRDFNLTQISSSYTTDAKTKTDDASRVRGLMALLGYNITDGTSTNGLDLSGETATLRQMGSVYHSLPVLLTQEGKTEAKRVTDADGNSKVVIESTGREDYVMFGTTQGLLSVVDAKYGTEKFSFVPSEMIENQSETFKENAGSLAGGKNALYYGLDGQWTAHTVYVTKSDGTLTVKGIVRDVLGSDEDKENLEGKQWVYGGMRMGGRSYYALDLTDINNPKLKFHIDPNTGKVYSAENPTGKEFSEIENMGQSWSKPKLDYVNWKGQRKLVMFVGGGYDAGGDHGDGLWADGKRTGYAGYEQYNYQQDNKRGAGVYMFDASTGDLLWYADANTPSTPTDPDGGDGGTSTGEAIPHLESSDLQYSVVSEIKTVDRNNDGMVDHLYFGDLAGQAFRIDFARDTNSFNSQITKILDLHESDGTSPRFYLQPTFTAHHSAFRKEGANIVVASFISGNQSSPLLATDDSPDTANTTGKKDSTGLQYDAVYAVYDYEIHPDGAFYPDEADKYTARTLAATDEDTATTSKLKYISHDDIVRSDADDDTRVIGAVADKETGWGGWYYRFDHNLDDTAKAQGVVKGLAPMIAMEGSLYVTMFDASDDGTSSDCSAGVKGKSFVQRLCLPTGVCSENANYSYNLGAGIVSLQVGPVSGNVKSIVVPDPDDIGPGCVGDDCKDGKNFIFAGGEIRFIPNRWYERYAKR
ncbi:hypothetical protein EJJ36_07050 [Acinetobacter junii]|uniref:hypothetical protein n=1 Tax=Acinetobacter junii TaxID=40215 RepID=UPI000F7E487A|nr:hypothetical protein [Acinetobacter junii]RTE46275.1 hypothetical protein EJJ36_07050 [Acinetobacter junii]